MSVLDQIRYKYDDPKEFTSTIEIVDKEKLSLKESHLKTLLSSSIQISKELFPTLAESVDNVFQRLKIENKFTFFITANHMETQAYCSSMPQSDSAEIVLTSKIVELLTANELEYVLGHEIAHFYFQHSLYPNPNEAKNRIQQLNALDLSRAAEISSDRVGFIAAGHLDHSLRAILKIASGLGEKHIQFDYEKYLDQLKQIESMNTRSGEILNTHPSFLNRVQALTWFSESKEYQKIFTDKNQGKHSLSTIDDKINESIKTITGKELEVSNKEILDRAVMWGALHICLLDKVFSKQEQAKFTEKFGDKAKMSIISLLKISNPALVSGRIKEYFAEANSLPVRDQHKIVEEIKSFANHIDGNQEQINSEIQNLEKLLRLK